jgi:hypothetical protein
VVVCGAAGPAGRAEQQARPPSAIPPATAGPWQVVCTTRPPPGKRACPRHPAHQHQQPHIAYQSWMHGMRKRFQYSLSHIAYQRYGAVRHMHKHHQPQAQGT